MAKSKSPAKHKTATKSKARKPKVEAKKPAGKVAKAAASVAKALPPKKATSPVAQPAAKPAVAKPVVAKPTPAPVAKPAAPQAPAAKPNTAQPHMSWSESLRKAMQDKNSQNHGPEHKPSWKDQQKSGLNISHRDKFG